MFTGSVVAQLVGEVFGGVGGIGKDGGKPVIFGVGVMEFYCWMLARELV